MSNTTYNKIETENPLLDEIVYNCKLILKTCIIKDERQAINYETEQSLKQSDIYMAIREKRGYFTMFDYNEKDITKACYGESRENIIKYTIDNKSIPKKYWDKLLKNKEDEFMSQYEELNDYYRRLIGLPGDGDKFIYMTDEYNNLLDTPISKTIPIHLLSQSEKDVLISMGIIKKMQQENPKLLWIKNFDKKLDLYELRKLKQFGLIYINEIDTEPVISSRFKQVFETNRIYILRTMDKDSLRYYNKYYDRFMMMLILAQTFCDMVAEMPDYIIRKDVFDIRTCEYFFEANGVDFFPDIPLKFQKKLVQNLNTLCKYSSTTRNIVDVCSIFGFKNMEVFKYYLCKEHKKDENGNYLEIDEEDLNNTYDLRFIKVPIKEKVDDYVKDTAAYESYDNVVSQDEKWDGPYDHDYIKNKILEKEFSIEKTKYLSIDSVYDLTKNSFTFVYFINMIMWSGIDVSSLNLSITSLSTTREINLLNAIIFLYSLMYMYMDVEDTILQTQSEYLSIHGFNFQADLEELSAYVAEKGFTLEELGVSGFTIPAGGILSLQQMIQIFINNKNIFDHVEYEMHRAQDINIYRCYKKIYDALFFSNLNRDYYKIDGVVANTYTELLSYKDDLLYSIIKDYEAITDVDIRNSMIYNTMSQVSNQILSWIDNDEFDNIFMNIPSNDRNVIHNYISEVINFFLSFKNTLLDFKNIYRVDSEHIFIIDEAIYSYYFEKSQYIKCFDDLEKYIVSLTKDDNSLPKDVLNSIERIFTRELFDKSVQEGKLESLKAQFYKEEWIYCKEILFNLITWYDRFYSEVNLFYDTIEDMNISLYKESIVKLKDSIEFNRIFSRDYVENNIISKENIDKLTVNLDKEEWIYTNDIIFDFYGWYEKYYSEANVFYDVNSLLNISLIKDSIIKLKEIASVDKIFSREYEESFKIGNENIVSVMSTLYNSEWIYSNDKIDYTSWYGKFFTQVILVNGVLQSLGVLIDKSDRLLINESIDIDRVYD